ncbi:MULTISPECIES: ADP-glyceromanno-heptose 6-epimerase [Sphingobacterium]|uniref:ADP-glyceromanno-heptose 6-epimerase n=1 Tax=Sphingobacterium TaxID=28453 RepID=UPI000B4941E2|nr:MULTISPECIES: ADP-glyceromanno-heptose 6-epimerase [Sphingobacterium]
MCNKKILITGACGFIGSCMVSYLNSKELDNLVLVDNFIDKGNKNLQGKKFADCIEPISIFNWIAKNKNDIETIIHLGANTDTQELDYRVHKICNELFTKKLWIYCNIYGIKLIYASSAATYGTCEGTLKDNHSEIDLLKPLNPYGQIKNEIDKWILKQNSYNPECIGLKFFNVYGPNEYHKGSMASMVYHCYNQIISTGKVQLFKSYHTNFEDGAQSRDFIYVLDIVKIIYWMLSNKIPSGIYNIGTGQSKTFAELSKIVFKGMSINPSIEYIEMPLSLRKRYQYNTLADISKLRSLGYDKKLFSLEEGIDDYLSFLKTNRFY